MIKRLFKDTIIYSFGTILTRGIQIIMLPIYTRLLTPADYGVYDLLNILTGLVNVTVALEITQGFVRHYSDAATEEERIAYSSTSFWFVLFMYCIFLTSTLLFSFPLSSLVLGKSYSPQIFVASMISIFGSGLFVFLQNQLRFYLKSKSFALVSIIFTLVSYSSTVVFLSVFKTGVVGIFWGLIAGYTVGNFLSWYMAKNHYRLVFNWNKCKEMLRFSIPLVPASIGTMIFLYIDRIAINSLMSKDELGLFGVAYRFSAIVTLVLSGFQIALGPLIYLNYKQSSTPGEIAKIFRYYLTMVLCFVLALSIFSIEALKIFTTPAYFRAEKVIPIISFATLFISMQIFAPGLALAKRTKTIAVINIVAGLMNSLLVYLLIPYLGIMGASFGTLLTAIMLFAVNMYFSQKLFYIPHNWRKILSMFAFCMVFILIIFIFGNFSTFPLFTKNVIKAILLFISASVIIRVMIGFEEFNIIIRQFIDLAKLKIKHILS
ncbi:MAG: oligosaccharide flippase family protein [Ignavibacteria bacterium]|jgi:O-antigen/teichoic acid export membrane protein|nr:oligosaccharide flippase family protein [Ignavibacteria bacterium]MCU7503339.1 oligosaccharide flippase family protein [Ignavibacteria bacterium]MCU7515715.1 oligosaccharide flippase family protein [Ignavibacteria bacterium]